ncbi:MAG TPA: hypothetical protein VGJ82_22515 [Thermoanaerobaculia bacterium]|jgi:hypothetical protein
MLEPKVVECIRTIFLYRGPRVSLARATALLGWTRQQMTAAVRSGEIEVTKTSAGDRISCEELWAKALEMWPLDVIEGALGPDADHVLPPPLRLTDLHARIPGYQFAMLQHVAERERTTVSHVLIRELEDMASCTIPKGAATQRCLRRR